MFLGGRKDSDNEEWKGQLKLNKLLDNCEKKGSLSSASTEQNNSEISGVHSSTFLHWLHPCTITPDLEECFL